MQVGAPRQAGKTFLQETHSDSEDRSPPFAQDEAGDHQALPPVRRHDSERITLGLLPRLVCYHVGAAPSPTLKMGGDPPRHARTAALASLPTRNGFPTWFARFRRYFQISPGHAAAKPRNSFAFATSASHFFNCSGVRKRSTAARSSTR